MKRVIIPAVLIGSATAFADPTGDLLARWVALDAAIGHEHIATDRLLDSLRDWERDTNGNLIRRVGSGGPRRLQRRRASVSNRRPRRGVRLASYLSLSAESVLEMPVEHPLRA